MEQVIYALFDGTNDIEPYKQMQEWELSNGDKFNFIDGLDLYNQLDKVSDDILKAQVKERMNLADIYVLIVNKTTKSYRRFIRWQVEHAINSGIPLIAINANGIRSVDYDRIPTVLKKNIAIHIAFQAKILEYAIQNWPSSFREYQAKEIKNSFKYSEEVYNQLGLETFDV